MSVWVCVTVSFVPVLCHIWAQTACNICQFIFVPAFMRFTNLLLSFWNYHKWCPKPSPKVKWSVAFYEQHWDSSKSACAFLDHKYINLPFHTVVEMGQKVVTDPMPSGFTNHTARWRSNQPWALQWQYHCWELKELSMCKSSTCACQKSLTLITIHLILQWKKALSSYRAFFHRNFISG